MPPVPKVVKDVVNNDLCIGCGVCVQACPNDAIVVDWNEYGFLVAGASNNSCEADGACINVCPFNPAPLDGLKNEDDLAEIFLKETLHESKKIGKYINIYAGYSKKYRETSSSGGVATYVFDRLLAHGLVDHIVSVSSSSHSSAHYEYTVISKAEDLLRTSKTRYFPVTLATALTEVRSLDGKVAISGVACFIKAIRLAQAHDAELKEKVAFLVGIICGGVKSSFFTEYLASKAGVVGKRVRDPEYRIKDAQSTAGDYAFACTDAENGRETMVKMRAVGDMWGTGLFKANACDYCDDVTTELADISLGDAWLPPYSEDGSGHNVIITRTPLAHSILTQGAQNGDLHLEPLSVEKLVESQQGSFSHRHDGLATRLAIAGPKAGRLPPKRHGKSKQPLYLALVQLARRNTRERSLITWRRCPSAAEFDKRMKLTLFSLRVLTKFARVTKRLIGKSVKNL